MQQYKAPKSGSCRLLTGKHSIILCSGKNMYIHKLCGNQPIICLQIELLHVQYASDSNALWAAETMKKSIGNSLISKLFLLSQQLENKQRLSPLKSSLSQIGFFSLLRQIAIKSKRFQFKIFKDWPNQSSLSSYWYTVVWGAWSQCRNHHCSLRCLTLTIRHSSGTVYWYTGSLLL